MHSVPHMWQTFVGNKYHIRHWIYVALPPPLHLPHNMRAQCPTYSWSHKDVRTCRVMSWRVSLALIKCITILCGTNNIPRNILHIPMYCTMENIPYNIVNLVEHYYGYEQCIEYSNLINNCLIISTNLLKNQNSRLLTTDPSWTKCLWVHIFGT